jgi:hypothetical protein
MFVSWWCDASTVFALAHLTFPLVSSECEPTPYTLIIEPQREIEHVTLRD